MRLKYNRTFQALFTPYFMIANSSYWFQSEPPKYLPKLFYRDVRQLLHAIAAMRIGDDTFS